MSKRNAMDVHVYPVPGHWLPGVPAAEQDVSEEEAAALVASGAFTLEPPAEEPVAPAKDEE